MSGAAQAECSNKGGTPGTIKSAGVGLKVLLQLKKCVVESTTYEREVLHRITSRGKMCWAHSTGCSQTKDVRRGNKIATNTSEYATVSVGRGVV